jgi:CHAT domain-containing protein
VKINRERAGVLLRRFFAIGITVLLVTGCDRHEPDTKQPAATAPADSGVQPVARIPITAPGRSTPPTDPRLREADELQRKGRQWLLQVNFDAAEPCFAGAYRIRSEVLGPLHTNTISSLYGLAKARAGFHFSGGDWEKALKTVKDLESAVGKAYPGRVRIELIEAYGMESYVYAQLENESAANAAGAKQDKLKAEAELAGGAEGESMPDQSDDPAWGEKKQNVDNLARQMAAGKMDGLTPKEQAGFALVEALQAGLKTNMKTGLDGRNHLLEVMKQFAEKNPEAAGELTRRPARKDLAAGAEAAVETDNTKPITGDEFLRGLWPSEDALRHQPEAWLAREWERWKTMMEGGLPHEMQMALRNSAGVMVTVPAEMEADPAVMAQTVLQLKGLLLEYEARLQSALATSTNAEMRSLATQLAAVQGQVDELMAKPLKEQSSPAAVAAFGQAFRLKKHLRAEAFSLMGEVRTNEPAVAAVAAQLPPGTALVEFMHYGRDTGITRPIEARYGALVLKRDGNPQWFPLESSDRVDALVREYHKQIRHQPGGAAGADPLLPVLRKLYATVWEPLRPALRGTTRVLISPDSALHLVSFSTLMSGERFLAEDYELGYVTSGRSLLQPPVRQAGRGMEMWADPDFNRADGSGRNEPRHLFRAGPGQSRAFFQTSFPALPGTAAEAQDLKRLATKKGLVVKVHEGPLATKAELLKVHGPLVLHLATHGFFSTNEFAGADQGLTGLRANVGLDLRSFFYRSGLALAGANPSLLALNRSEITQQDATGLAFAAELTLLDLRGTWLATLSACDTGVGGIAEGEDVMGLKRALLQAGAQNVLCSLWRVNDSYTSQFMQDFYTAALASGDAAGALAELQRRRLRESGGVPLSERIRLAGPFVLTTSGDRRHAVISN